MGGFILLWFKIDNSLHNIELWLGLWIVKVSLKIFLVINNKYSYYCKKLKVKGKVVIITGASSGIGEALAYEFALAGSKIVLGARNQEKLISIAEDIRNRGGEAVYC